MNVSAHLISHTYTLPDKSRLAALQSVDLSLASGEFVTLVGPSGCGKSTLLRILAGLLNPSQGEILLNGASPSDGLRKKKIGWLAQSPALLPWKSVRDNIALAQQINHQNGRKVLAVDEYLELVGLAEFGAAYPFNLSGGMQHRTALARTLALGAELWLMDEPFAALDELTREALAEEVLGLWQRFRPSVVWVTHHLYEAAHLADRILVMSARPGRITAEIAIKLPRPRQEANPEFQAVIARLRTALRQPKEQMAA